MPTYYFTAVDSHGARCEGRVVEKSGQRARERLESRYTQVSVQRDLQTDIDEWKRRLRRVSRQEQSEFFRQLAILYKSGVPLADALTVLCAGAWSPTMMEMLVEVDRELHAGHYLSEALARREIFNAESIALVKVGEDTGAMSDVLDRVASLLERDVRTRQKIGSAMTYPLIMMAGALVIMAGMLIFFVPQMTRVLRSMNVEFSPVMNALLTMSELLCHPMFLGMLGEILVVGAAIFFFWSRTDDGRRILDETALALPLIRRVTLASGLSRLAYSFALLQKTGVNPEYSLNILPRGMHNTVLARSVERARERLIDGHTLAESFGEELYFQGFFVQMLEVGEESSRVDAMMEWVHQLYDEQLESILSTATALIEPIVLCGMGLMVGAMILSFMIPLAQIIQQL